jgi:hypothetical protein
MTVYTDSIIKGFDIFENKAVSLPVVGNAESVKSFSFDEGVEGFYTARRIMKTSDGKFTQHWHLVPVD